MCPSFPDYSHSLDSRDQNANKDLYYVALHWWDLSCCISAVLHPETTSIDSFPEESMLILVRLLKLRFVHLQGNARIRCTQLILGLESYLVCDTIMIWKILMILEISLCQGQSCWSQQLLVLELSTHEISTNRITGASFTQHSVSVSYTAASEVYFVLFRWWLSIPCVEKSCFHPFHCEIFRLLQEHSIHVKGIQYYNYIHAHSVHFPSHPPSHLYPTPKLDFSQSLATSFPISCWYFGSVAYFI